MNKLITLILIAVFIVGCAARTQADGPPLYPAVKISREGLHRIYRIVDEQKGMICYIYSSAYSSAGDWGGISCVPVSQTLAR